MYCIYCSPRPLVLPNRDTITCISCGSVICYFCVREILDTIKGNISPNITKADPNVLLLKKILKVMTLGQDYIPKGPCCTFPGRSSLTHCPDPTSEPVSVHGNPFDGAMYVPCFNLAIQTTATNHHWYCDHHALAKSVDGTPSIAHCVLDRELTLTF